MNCLLVPAAAAAGLLGAFAPPKAGPEPSANKGRTGEYNAPTKVLDYSYHVCVPSTYSDESPAGLHLFFNGQGGCSDNSWFGQWKGPFLEKYNLIGVNMKYPDGDNMKNSAQKVEAAREAIAQVMADYKIVAGRGAVGCFSGGGVPNGLFWKTHGKVLGPEWPFCHAALYSANFRASATGPVQMTWFMGVGTEEWGLASLGATQTGRMEERLADALKAGCPDAYCKVLVRGHTIDDRDVAESAAMFARSDLAFAPFVYAPDYAEPDLAKIAEAANALALGKAEKMLGTLVKRKGLDPKLERKAGALAKLVDERVGRILALVGELAKADPVLAGYYGRVFAAQLRTHSREKELKDVLTKLQRKREFLAAGRALQFFAREYGSVFKGPKADPEKREFLKQVGAAAGEESFLGRMAAEYLALPE